LIRPKPFREQGLGRLLRAASLADAISRPGGDDRIRYLLATEKEFGNYHLHE
jgi:hypothetical protein